MKKFNAKVFIKTYYTGIIAWMLLITLFVVSAKHQPREAIGSKDISLIADETYSQSHGAYIVVSTFNEEIRAIIEKDHTYYKNILISNDDGYNSRGYSYYYRKSDYKAIIKLLNYSSLGCTLYRLMPVLSCIFKHILNYTYYFKPQKPNYYELISFKSALHNYL